MILKLLSKSLQIVALTMYNNKLLTTAIINITIIATIIDKEIYVILFNKLVVIVCILPPFTNYFLIISHLNLNHTFFKIIYN